MISDNPFAKILNIKIANSVSDTRLGRWSGIAKICSRDWSGRERRGGICLLALRGLASGVDKDRWRTAVWFGKLVSLFATKELTMLSYNGKMEAKGFVGVKGSLTGNNLITKVKLLSGTRAKWARGGMVVVRGASRCAGHGLGWRSERKVLCPNVKDVAQIQ